MPGASVALRSFPRPDPVHLSPWAVPELHLGKINRWSSE